MKTKLIIISTIVTSLSYGQTSTFKWNDNLCSCESKYYNKRYSESQIINCYKLTCQEEFRIQNIPSVFKPKDIERLNLDTLDNEYKNKSNLLKKLELPKTQYWEDLRKSTLKELEQLYNLSRIAYQSFSNPKYLTQFNHTDSCLLIHSNSLIAGGDSLLNDWFELTSQNVKKSGMPERMWNKYHIKLNSKDKLIYARVEVTTFGWWNCANEYVYYTNNYINTETRLKEFAKLFFKTRKFDCAEP